MTNKEDSEESRSSEIDFSDPRVVEDWLRQVDTRLDDSDRQALSEEIGRQFRRAPAGAQASGLAVTREKISWVLEQIRTQETDEVRMESGELRDQILKDVEALLRRIIELQTDDPDS